MKKRTVKLAIALGVALLIALAAEIFLFNFTALRTAGGEWTDLPEPEITGEVESTGKGKYIFRGVDCEISSCRINIIARDEDGELVPVELKIRVTDEGHSSFYEAGTVSYSQYYTRGSYFTVHSYGEVHDIEVTPSLKEDCALTLDFAAVNGPVPVFFSVKRVAAIFAVLALICLLRPSSALHKNAAWNRRRFAKLVCVVLVFAVNAALLFGLVQVNEPYVEIPEKDNWLHHHQYALLARSLAEGRLSIETPEEKETAIKWLEELEDPYDTGARTKLFEDNDSHAPWDIAYYDGHLYVYFGVLPVLVGYLPYYLITGQDLPTWTATFTALLLILCAAYLFMRAVVRRFFPRTPFTVYMMLSVLLGNCTCALQYSLAPGFYSLPIAMAVAFVLFGLSLWITAAGGWEASLDGAVSTPDADADEYCFAPARKPMGNAGVRARLIFGGLFMALVAGCRPQLLVSSVLAFPIFWGVIKRERLSARLVRRVLLALAPFAAVGAGIMWYNAARFGSPFDFGANYNLTTNDMTLRGFDLARLPDGFFEYLFRLPNIGLSFPFVGETPRTALYFGKTIRETMPGGALICNCFLWILLLSRRAGKDISAKRLGGFALTSLCLAAVVIAADTEMAGILARYFGDFLVMLYIPAALVFLSLYEKAKGKQRSRLTVFLTAALLVTLAYDLFMGITVGELARQAPESFRMIRSLFI